MWVSLPASPKHRSRRRLRPRSRPSRNTPRPPSRHRPSRRPAPRPSRARPRRRRVSRTCRPISRIPSSPSVTRTARSSGSKSCPTSWPCGPTRLWARSRSMTSCP
ncbi:MAG: hypothetical protein D6692_12270 [Planctomycetota bacterium]|nr:MAG: hypothetical protein D6692_12270 [Planctomycetota bacterium]